jgi:PilZ domain-containing protein
MVINLYILFIACFHKGSFSMEKRNFTRVDFSECASIKHDNQVFFGDIKNMSLQGLFITIHQELPLNTEVDITVYHSSDSSFRLRASVVRREETGHGMQINGMDVNSFAHLRDLVAMQCNDQELVMRETYKMAGCIQ